MGVGVHREALGAGRGEVGVGLAGVAELELELGDQVGDRRPVALEALQHDRRALVVQAHQLHRVDQAGQRLAGQAAAAGEGRLRAAPSRCGRRGPPARGSRSRSAGGRRRPATRVRAPRSGSVRWTCTDDAQVVSMKTWASPVSRSSALRAPTRPCRQCRRHPCRRRRSRRCRRRRWSRRRWRRSSRRRWSRRRCRRRPHRRCRRRPVPGAAGTPVGSTPSVVISSSPRGLSGVVVMDPPHSVRDGAVRPGCASSVVRCT